MVLVSLAALELGLRAYKSITYDGVLHVATPSNNNELHPRFGWLSPASTSFEKRDACYGSGRVSYNEAGFRARPLAEAKRADVVVCILGDSTMQGFQLPDGMHLPHLLEAELRKTYKDPYVLPLAVGGYGTVQEWMLFEEFCKPLAPAALILHWDGNDAGNNSFLADRYSGAANNLGRARPYWEDGALVMRYPYPLQLADRLDELLLFKLANTVLLKLTAHDPERVRAYVDRGFAVAGELAQKIARELPIAIALVDPADTRAAAVFKASGMQVVVHPPIPDAMRCRPRDSHATTEGHALMLRALMPVLADALHRRRQIE